MTEVLRASNVETMYGRVMAIRGISLTVKEGSVVTVMGSNGAGKTTILKTISGALDPFKGQVEFEGRDITALDPDVIARAGIAHSPEGREVFSLLSVKDNLMMGAYCRKDRDEVARDFEKVLGWFPVLREFLDKQAIYLSGGQQQRVAIARALAMEPKVLLLDEPFGALDALTRAHLQDSLMEIHADLGNTVIMITHDVDEAVLLSDRIVMMTNGPAATVGEILEVNLPRPRDRLVLADNPEYNHYRHEVLTFLYEKQKKVEPVSARKSGTEKGASSSKTDAA